jgi:hypothetical protein
MPWPRILRAVDINTRCGDLPPFFLACRLPQTLAVFHSFCTTILFREMLTETTAPSLLFITSLVSLILIAFQVSSLHKSRWDIHNVRGTRQLLALSVTLFIVFLSALSGVLGLVACQAGRTGDRSRAARAGVGGKLIVVILQSGRKSMHMSSSETQSRSSLGVHDVSSEPESSRRAYTLAVHRHSHLWESEDSHSCDVLPARSEYVVSLLVDVIYLIRNVLDTVLSIVFAALQEEYPAARFPALCWLLFFIPLFCVSILLYLSIRRAEEYSIVARMWLVLAVGHACGVLSATCALAGKGDFQAPTSLFDAFWITCVTFALHSPLFRPPWPSPRLPPLRSSFYFTRSVSQSPPFRTYSVQARGSPPRSCDYSSSQQCRIGATSAACYHLFSGRFP